MAHCLCLQGSSFSISNVYYYTKPFNVFPMRKNERDCFVVTLHQHPDQLAQIEQEAIRLSEEIRAEYWAVSALSGNATSLLY